MLPTLSLPPETFRAVLESLPAAVYLVDLERRIVFWNDGCERITGYRRHEVIARCCADSLLMHCDENHGVLCGNSCPLIESMRDGRPCEADLFLRHRDGQRIPVRVRAVPLRDAHDNIIGACECFDERVVTLPQDHQLQLVEPPAVIDEVTQLPDRQALLRRLQAELRTLDHSPRPVGVLCLTVDDVEGLRAFDGTIAVNRVLYATAQTLAKTVGPGNLVGRWSARRFVAVLRDCTEETLLESAITLKRLAALEAVPWWGDSLSITLSAGGTLARAGDTPEDLVHRAEGALNGVAKNGVSQAVVV